MFHSTGSGASQSAHEKSSSLTRLRSPQAGQRLKRATNLLDPFGAGIDSQLTRTEDRLAPSTRDVLGAPRRQDERTLRVHDVGRPTAIAATLTARPLEESRGRRHDDTTGRVLRRLEDRARPDIAQ
ncbi:MAG: hypothetical protein U0271_43740 [Polyangiaceae bacterium]